MSQETFSDRLVAGRYRLTGVLGRGGMGVVWSATDEVIGRQVAVKEIRAPAEDDDDDNDIFMARALAEARNVGRISHPGVVALYDVIPAGQDDDAVYLIMELVAAPTLERLIKVYGKMPSHEVAEIGLQILDALEAAHALDVVHRDVKPGNVLVLPSGQVKLLDFGIARAATDPRLTQWGALGTVSYMAPERFAPGPITPAVDYWALGATLYRAATGSGPFERESTAQTLQAIIYQDPPTPDCEARLAAVISALLARNPDDRPTADRARAMLRDAAKTQLPTQADHQADRSPTMADSNVDQSPTRPGRDTDRPWTPVDSETAQSPLQADTETAQSPLQADTETNQSPLQADSETDRPPTQADGGTDRSSTHADGNVGYGSLNTAVTLPAPRRIARDPAPDPQQESSAEAALAEAPRPETAAARAIKPLAAAALWLFCGVVFLTPGVTVIAIAAKTMLTDSNAATAAERFVGPGIGALVGLAMIALAVFPISIGIRELKDLRAQRADARDLLKGE
ncbi:serine/threonine-protein kinase [Nocardia sp. KC 131]|uniref:serine/threonine-protein kinase n=1 Tax=Nocardia arseniciresistens TaxID=3392119 RepID=UPI00398EBAC9